ncbi:hypothetical protein FACS189487_00720 [Campylobacterota bacterium]|nr:hypothetical protein FACS189487_00720 [Campylobacterota bacterium]
MNTNLPMGTIGSMFENMISIIIFFGLIVIISAGALAFLKVKAGIATEKNKRETKQTQKFAITKEKIEKGEKYERQIGAELQKEGYIVKYRGLERGKEDGGIDLIAKKDDEIMLVQCKNWISEVHQKDIKAFYASCDEYLKIEKPEQQTIKYRIISANGLTQPALKQIETYQKLGTDYKSVVVPYDLGT